MEGIIRDNLASHLETVKTINARQHGFLHGRSCLTNLLEAFEEWTRALDDGYGVDVIYLDYRKAFDSVPHKKLIQKLKSNGIDRRTTAWVEHFLMQRKMRVGVSGSFSSWADVLSGVPQGSVLDRYCSFCMLTTSHNG